MENQINHVIARAIMLILRWEEQRDLCRVAELDALSALSAVQGRSVVLNGRQYQPDVEFQHFAISRADQAGGPS